MIDHIFVDLDECLVSTVWKHNGSGAKNRTKIILRNNWLNKDEIYWSCLRPCALEFLDYCRSIAPTKILTAAATDYAQEHNKTFSLGFSNDDIIGRNDYVRWTSGMFHSRAEATKIDQYPKSILVDNQSLKDFGCENLVVKMAFLGIKETRLVKSREYTGGKQPPSFNKEIDQINKILETFK
jgi:hypothetical protein